jgi:CRP-like cAMP-binding protein
MDWQKLIVLQPTLAKVPADLRLLAEQREFNSGETLYRIGDPVQWVLLVISGEIRLVRRNRNGTEVVLQRSRGGFFAEASLTSKSYHCDVITAEKGELLRLPAKAFQAALDNDAFFRNAWMARLAQEVRRLRAQSERLSLHTAAERIIHYIESESIDSAITLHQSRKAWASELALTHEALYRTLRKLQTEAKIKVDGNRIVFLG